MGHQQRAGLHSCFTHICTKTRLISPPCSHFIEGYESGIALLRHLFVFTICHFFIPPPHPSVIDKRQCATKHRHPHHNQVRAWPNAAKVKPRGIQCVPRFKTHKPASPFPRTLTPGPAQERASRQSASTTTTRTSSPTHP